MTTSGDGGGDGRDAAAALFEAYRLDAQLGAGGMAVTWRARERIGGTGERFVALKQILPEHARDPEFRAMFFDEVRIAALIRHRNVCQIYRAGEHEGVLFMAMEYVDGCSLSELVDRWRARGDAALPPEHVLYLASEMLDGLHAAHTLCDVEGRPLHIVHRDVSPQNVLISRRGELKLIDFGIARGSSSDSHTRTGAIKGKLLYLCPEQLEGLRADARGDLFSAGLVLYELLCGFHPLRGDSDFSTLFNYATRTIEAPGTHREGLGPEIDALVMRALERDPQRRWPSARAMAEACLDALHTLRPGYRAAHFEAFVAAALDPSVPLDDISRSAPLITASGLEHADTAQMQAVPVRPEPPQQAPAETARSLEVAAPGPQPAPHGESAAPLPRPKRSWRAAIVALAVLLALGGAVGAGYLLGGGRDEAASAPAPTEPAPAAPTAATPAAPSATAAAAAAPEVAVPPRVVVIREEAPPPEPQPPAPEPEPEVAPPPVAASAAEADAVEPPPVADAVEPPPPPQDPAVLLLAGDDDDAAPIAPSGTWDLPPAAVQAPEISVLEELDVYAQCLGRAEPRMRDSLARYLLWVNPRTGPTCSELNVYGLYEVYVDGVAACEVAASVAESAGETRALAPLLATAAERFAALTPLITDANRYYDSERYALDDCAWGRENHGALMEGFASTGEAFTALRLAMTALRIEAERARMTAIEAAHGRNLEYHLRNTLLLLDAALALHPDFEVWADTATLQWVDPSDARALAKVDAEGWARQLEAFVAASDALQAAQRADPSFSRVSGCDDLVAELLDVADAAVALSGKVRGDGVLTPADLSRLRSAGMSVPLEARFVELEAPLFSLSL